MRDEEGFSQSMGRQARDWARQAGAAGERLARVGRLQLDLLGLRREEQAELRALGERVLDLVRAGAARPIEEDPIAGPILKKLDRLEGERIRRQEQIDRAREATGPAKETD